jgi:hypothetical protein
LRDADRHFRLGSEGVYAKVPRAAGKELLILPAEPDVTRSWSGKAKPTITVFSGTATTNETYRCNDGQVFEDCIKVTLKLTQSLGWSQMPARYDRWFAPGVGMVAEVREVGKPDNPHTRLVSELTRTER